MTLSDIATTDDIEALRVETINLVTRIASLERTNAVLRESLEQWHDIATTLAVLEGERAA